MSSTGCFVVSADKADTAIAFQSAMTAGSPSDAGGVAAAAVAVPAERAARSGTAAQKASHPRTRAGRLQEERRWLNVCIFAPRAGALGGDTRRPGGPRRPRGKSVIPAV